TAADRHEIVVASATPGLMLRVLRMAESDPDPGEFVAVPPDGRVTVALPLLPWPALLPHAVPFAAPSLRCWMPLGLAARTELAGVAGPERAIVPGEVTRIPAPAGRDERAQPARGTVSSRDPDPDPPGAASGDARKDAKTGTLRVRVRRAEGALRGATVRLDDTCGAAADATGVASADSRGVFEVAVPEGKHELLALGEGFVPARVPFEVKAGQRA